MGFGLHVGWAIEGAIGSFYKIDASYLSPNVNMASRLEAATKQFGVQLLISGQLFIVLTETAQ
jgi:class 3 adenylate cyclase